MGEIIYSIFVGGILVITGVAMNLYLNWEEKHVCRNRSPHDDDKTKDTETNQP